MDGRPAAELNSELLERLAVDGRAGFKAIFEAHGKTVMRYAWKLAANAADAEEIAQDTFLTLWSRRRKVVADQAAILPWLLATCRNHGGNLQRRNIKHRTDALDFDRADESARSDAADQLAWIKNEIRSMTPLDQAIVQMCLIDGLPYRDAARELGIGYAAVAKRVQRTRTHLKQVRSESEGGRL